MIPVIRYTLAFLVLPTLLFALLKTQFFIIRGLVDLDYLLAGALLPFVGALVAGCAVAAALAFDLLLAFAPAFHFRAGGFLESIEYVFDIELWFVAGIAIAVLVATAAYGWLTVRIAGRGRGSRPAGVAMLALVPALVVADGLTTGNAFMKGDAAGVGINVATSSTFETVRSGYRWFSYVVEPEAPSLAATTDPIRERLDRGDPLPKNIVVVVSESHGLFHEPEANEVGAMALSNPQLLQRYEIERGSIPFHSSTVPGELRELCGVLKRTTAPRPDELPMDQCLPNRLREMGYRTVAAHGFAGSFFNRRRWYPMLGFERLLFGRDIDAAAESRERCGVAFTGVCDDIAMDVLRDDLAAHRDQRNFIYWLTLNAHTPYPQPRERYGSVDCNRSRSTSAHDEICRLAGIYHVVLGAVVETALQPWLEDAAFFIVGDHAPPLIRSELRELFDLQRVPYTILWPRAQGALRLARDAD